MVATETVFRLISAPLFTPADTRVRLPASAFSASTGDENEALARGFPHPFLSVFCLSKTTIAQSERILTSRKARKAYAISVGQLGEAAKKLNHPATEVLSDALPVLCGAGRRGHALIKGLAAKGLTKPLKRAMLDEIDQRCHEVTPENEPARSSIWVAIDAIDNACAFVARRLVRANQSAP